MKIALTVLTPSLGMLTRRVGKLTWDLTVCLMAGSVSPKILRIYSTTELRFHMFKEIFKDYSKKERIAVSVIGSVLMALVVVLLFHAITTQ